MKLNWQKFIDFWKQFYEYGKYPDENFYDTYINDLSKDDFLEKLWQWKMQVYYSKGSNQRALKLMEEDKEIIRNFRKFNPSFDEVYNFARKFFKNGLIYQVFLMHICRPEEYPIFDQHVFRSFIFLTEGKIVEFTPNVKDYGEYKSFVFRIHKKYKIGLRDIDKGLMPFGQFLKNHKIKE